MSGLKNFKHTDTIREKVNNFMKVHSRLDTKRNHLGMSQIGDCSRYQYKSFFTPLRPEMKDYRNSYRGYHLEGHFRKMLQELDLMSRNSSTEIIADFDPRFKGHIDGFNSQGDLIEIKSMAGDRFEKVLQTGKIPFRHFVQCQAYMKYGKFDTAYMILISTGTFELLPVRIVKNLNVQSQLEEKAKMILKCIDEKKEPECECGKCALVQENINQKSNEFADLILKEGKK